MIVFTFNQETYETKVSGHANFSAKGSDIVCASVSTAILISANLIKVMEEDKYVDIELTDGHFHIKVNNLTPNIKAILDNLVWSLNELTKQYPRNIKYKKER